MRYYLNFLSFDGYAPSLVNICGLAVFFLCLAPVWEAARLSYQRVFVTRYARRAFFWLHCRTQLPIVLPWIFLSLAADAVGVLPFPRLLAVLASSWGEFFLFFIFILVVTIFVPPLVRRLWGCVPLPDGPLRQRLAACCVSQGFHDGLYLWPLFEGRMMTAAVMGVVPGLRFILLTPAIIESTSEDELRAVLAHELGHVKKRHLLWYVLLLSGFSALMSRLQTPLLYLLLPPDCLENLLITTGIAPATLVTIGQSLPLLVALLLFFRFVFGWFMRNFERQADLSVIEAMGNGWALISTFERLAYTSGGRERPSWHHFSLGERIRAIEAAEADPGYIVRHDKKVRRALAGYFIAVIVAIAFCASFHDEAWQERRYDIAITTGVLKRQMRLHPEDPRFPLALADFEAHHGLEGRALANYETALKAFPDMAELLNNFAWFLVTCHDLSRRDPERALTMARLAVASKPAGHTHDTLATAYWANGLTEQAIEEELRAIALDPDNRQEYLAQLARFKMMTYQESLRKQETP
ncbi:MAG TPA: peptidase M48 Ste24p [Desulfobulbaceae bacterium]|nr:peptidase M48 Ste24p [Desulfobulbaceae bacterium]